jgi:hypothetical protein
MLVGFALETRCLELSNVETCKEVPNLLERRKEGVDRWELLV